MREIGVIKSPSLSRKRKTVKISISEISIDIIKIEIVLKKTTYYLEFLKGAIFFVFFFVLNFCLSSLEKSQSIMRWR